MPQTKTKEQPDSVITDRRKKYEILRAQLELERASFLADWREVGEFILPRRPRFDLTDVNRGGRRNTKIIDATASLAVRTLRSGMTSYVTSPARPWFKLTTPNPAYADVSEVKIWLNDVTRILSDIFLKSNLYNSLPIVYGDMGVFATSAMLIEEDFDDTIRTYVFPVGSYMIATDSKGKVCVFFREFRMTVRQLVEKFAVRNEQDGKPLWFNLSDRVKTCYENGQHDTWIDVCHVIQPNPDYDPRKLHSKYKKFVSCYYERGGVGDGQAYAVGDTVTGKFLRESGYDYFPVLCPRWEVNAEDAYGTNCPGFEAVGDTKQLQSEQKRKSQAIEKGIFPAMVGPTALRSVKASLLPGDITYSDERDGTKGFRPAHDVKLDLQHLLLDIQSVQKIISRAFYEDLFLVIISGEDRERTATEIEARREEKLLALGPVLDQLNKDLLNPLIDITYAIAERQSKPLWGTKDEKKALLPPPPDILAGMDLKVEYISVMAQAQKLVGVSTIERFSAWAVNLAAQTGDAKIIRKINVDQMIDIYSDRLGLDPSIIYSDEQVQQMIVQEQQAQAQQQMVEVMDKGAGAASKMAKAAHLFAQTQTEKEGAQK